MSFFSKLKRRYAVYASSISFINDLRKEFETGGWDDYGEYLAESDEWGDGDTPLLDEERTDSEGYSARFSKFIKDLQKSLKMNGNNLILYRAINLKNKDRWLKKLKNGGDFEDKANVGVSWSYKKSGAVPYHGGDAPTYILKAIVPRKSVSITETVGLNISFDGPGEAEVRLKNGAPLTLIEISKGGRSEKLQVKTVA